MSLNPAPHLAEDENPVAEAFRGGWWSHCAPVLACRQELANTITHALGLVLSLVGAVVLIRAAVEQGGLGRILASAAYAASLVAVYAASTLSHLVHEPRWRSKFRSLDQGCIFLLIVGTYTPFGVLLPGWNWPLQLLIIMWALAFTGFISKVFFSHRVEAVSIMNCIVLGWLPCTSIPSFAGLLPVECMWFMIAGGLAYSLGTLFLMLDQRGWFYHATWHLFVITGSTLHYLGILWYAVPA